MSIDNVTIAGVVAAIPKLESVGKDQIPKANLDVFKDDGTGQRPHRSRVRIACWRELAQRVSHLKPGIQVLVQARIRTRDDSEGSPIEVVGVDVMELVARREVMSSEDEGDRFSAPMGRLQISRMGDDDDDPR